jgi:hypothetical protein
MTGMSADIIDRLALGEQFDGAVDSGHETPPSELVSDSRTPAETVIGL